ncbi:MAG: NAD-dependent epimerase/dehydratase family protein [Micropruina sp.]
MPSILFLGGTGRISASCVTEAVGLGFEVAVVNRGRSGLRPLPEGVESLRADLNDDASLTTALVGREFDVVADFMSFAPDRLQRNVDLLTDRVGQYVFISTASAYAKPVPSLPIRESTPLRNPFWQYSRDKIACEDFLTARYREHGFPATIVRPSHTYDRFGSPLMGGWTQIARMRQGRPVLVHGDGTSLWTLTHASDFAYSFAGVLGHPAAIGQAFHITGDEFLTWDAIATALATAAGVREPLLVHVSSEAIAARLPDHGDALLGDKAHSVIFDNTAVRALRPGFVQRVPFHVGARQIIDAYDANPERQIVDAELDAALDELTGVLPS